MDQAMEKSAASKGGAARMSQLNHAGRQALGRKAAEARWGKTKDSGQPSVDSDQHLKAKDPASAIEHPMPAETKPSPPKDKKRAARLPAPKAFRGAHSYAERRLAEAIKERAQAMHKLSMLEAEIPSLVAIIKALQNTPQPAPLGGLPPQPDLGLAAARPPFLNRAHGGAMGVNLNDAADEEDTFLKDSIVAQGEWH